MVLATWVRLAMLVDGGRDYGEIDGTAYGGSAGRDAEFDALAARRLWKSGYRTQPAWSGSCARLT